MNEKREKSSVSEVSHDASQMTDEALAFYHSEGHYPDYTHEPSEQREPYGTFADLQKRIRKLEKHTGKKVVV